LLEINIDSLKEKLKSFSNFGKTEGGGVSRLLFTKPEIEARNEFCRRMEKIGAEICTDDMGNIYATIKGNEDLPAIVTGSHCDSVVKGGNYDGILGVLAAMEVLETIVKEDIYHRHPITAIIWTNEEGVRFDPVMMGSGVVAGKFSREDILKAKDTEGITFEEALKNSGFLGQKENRLKPENTLANLELHIEQGPVLEMEEKSIGVLEGVIGMLNYAITLKGRAGHAGTVPMKYRKDAFLAASNALIYLHDKLKDFPEDLVFTNGQVFCHPNVNTVIADEFTFIVDARHKDPEVIKRLEEVIKNMPKEFNGCKLSYKKQWTRDTVKFNEKIVEIVENSTKALGYDYKKMYSGPGHDSQYIADIIPTSMIFVPSKDGDSHCEWEYTSLSDCHRGVNVLLHSILKLDNEDRL